MQLTPIYKFKKRELSDSPPDITANNSNWDVLETNLKSHGDSIASQSKQIDVLLDYKYPQQGITTNNLPSGKWYLRSIENPTDDFYYIECGISPATGYRYQKAKYVFDNNSSDFERVKINGTWIAWEDKIGTLSNDRGYLTSKIITSLDDTKINGKYIFNGAIEGINGIWLVDVTFGSNRCIQNATVTWDDNGLNRGRTFKRFYNDGTWQPWKDEIGTLNDLIKTTTVIKDLNDFKNDGDTENFDVNTLNKPSFISDGYVTCHRWWNRWNNNSCQQIAQGWSEGGGSGISRMGMRTFNNDGNWSEWKELATTSKINISYTLQNGLTVRDASYFGGVYTDTHAEIKMSWNVNNADYTSWDMNYTILPPELRPKGNLYDIPVATDKGYMTVSIFADGGVRRGDLLPTSAPIWIVGFVSYVRG